MAGKKEIRDLSDFELLSELKSLGLKIGPISPTTRRIYEKKLSRARGCDVVDSTHENQATRVDVGESACTNSIDVDSTNSSSEALESPVIFYGICFDVARSSSESGLPSAPVVFTSKDEALKTAKKFKGARFKGFKTRVEAEGFSRSRSTEQGNSPAVTSSLSSPTDPVSNFKGPTPQELVKFRKIIELGSRDEFLEMVLKNPRYLIGPGDTPVVLQEGFRYNALHVAVKSNRKEMCQVIIDTLESEHFWNILLNQDTQSAMNSQRKQFLVDMYLNTPDKGYWETPLHFACKYGHAEVVEYLVSHPLTDVQRTNKYGEMPIQLICTRCTAPSSELKNQIKTFLEDSFYVPLLGSMDNSTPPWIGGPWSPEVTDENIMKEPGSQRSPLNNLKQKSSPGELPITVRAYAGPMSPSKADEFYHAWKTPPRVEQRSSYMHIKRKDDSRGVERIGRELAHNGRIPWTEYWNFLGCYADLSSLQGLEKLEDYLAKKKDKILLSRLSVTPQRVGSVKKTSSIVLKTPESRQSSVILNDNGLLRQTGSTGCYGDESGDADFSGAPHLSKKILFLDSESEAETKSENMEVKTWALQDSKQKDVVKSVSTSSPPLNQTSDSISNKGVETTLETENGKLDSKKGKLQDSKQQDVMKSVSTSSPPLNQTSDSISNEAVVESVTETLDMLTLSREQVASEKTLDISLDGNVVKRDLLNESRCSVEGSNGKGDVDVVSVLPCKKKLSYHLPESNNVLFEAKDELLSGAVSLETDEQIKMELVEDRIDVEQNFKNSTMIIQNTANEDPSSSSLLLTSPSASPVGNCPLRNSKKNFYDNEVFENTPGTDAKPAKQDYSDSGSVVHPVFKVPEKRNIRQVKCQSCSHVLGSGNEDFSIFIQGLQPSKLDLDVLIAIGEMNIDSRRYPCSARWKKLVMSYSEATQQSWPSPGSPRYHTRHKSLMWSC